MGRRQGPRSRAARDGGPAGLQYRGINPFDQVDWDLRTAEIKDERGRAIFQQIDCEVPRNWSQLATNVVASKYFYGEWPAATAVRPRASASFRFAS